MRKTSTFLTIIFIFPLLVTAAWSKSVATCDFLGSGMIAVTDTPEVFAAKSKALITYLDAHGIHAIAPARTTAGHPKNAFLLESNKGPSALGRLIRELQEQGIMVYFDPLGNQTKDIKATFDRKLSILYLSTESILELSLSQKLDSYVQHELSHIEVFKRMLDKELDWSMIVAKNTIDGGALSHGVSEKFKRFYGQYFPFDEYLSFKTEQSALREGSNSEEFLKVNSALSESLLQMNELGTEGRRAANAFQETGQEHYRYRIIFTQGEYYKNIWDHSQNQWKVNADGTFVREVVYFPKVRFQLDGFDLELPATSPELFSAHQSGNKQEATSTLIRLLQDVPN